MSLSEFEALLHLCELERTQILQSLALALLKIPYTGYYYQATAQISLIMKVTFFAITLALKSFTNESLYFI